MIRAALTSLLARKGRLVMSTFAVVLGVAFVVGTLILSDTLNRSFTALFSSTVGDVVVRPQGNDTTVEGISARTVPAAVVDELAALPGAARADGNVQAFGVFVVDADGDLLGGPGPPSIAGSYNDAPAAGGAGLQLTVGAAPSGPTEVVLLDDTAERAGYDVGDRVPLLLPSSDRTRITPTVVGILGFPEGGSLNGATYVGFDTATAQALFLDGEDAFSDVWVTGRDGVSQQQLAEEAAGVLPEGVEAVTGDVAADEQASELLEAISFITTFLLIFAGIALVVGSFLIVNTFSMLLAQRSRELALLRALGASRRQVLGSVQLESFVLGLVGSTLGLALGIALAFGLRALFMQFGLDLSGQSLVLRPRAFLAAYGVGVLVTMSAALGPARRTTRIAPVQALRDEVALPEGTLLRRFALGVVVTALGAAALAVGLGALGDLEGDAGLWSVGAGVLLILLGVTAASPLLSRPLLAVAQLGFARVFGSVGLLAAQNSRRNPRRTAATASALMIGLTLACTMTIVGDSAKASVDRTVAESFVGDYVVTGVGFGLGFNPAIADQLEQVDGVATLTRQRFEAVQTAGGDREGVVAVDPGRLGLFALRVEAGEVRDLVERTVIVSRTYAAEHAVSVGDELSVRVPAGEQRWRVVAVYADSEVLGSVVTTLDTFAQAGFQPLDSRLYVEAADAAPGPGTGGTGSPGLQQRLEDAVDNPTVTVSDQREFAAQQRAPIDQFVLIIYALLGLALLIAVLGIVNTLALSILERTREVGLLRAIGLGRGQLRWMVTLESVVIAVLGAVLGVVLGVGFGVALMTAVREEGLEVISVPWGQLTVYLALAVVVGVTAAVLPARRAARLDVLRAITTE